MNHFYGWADVDVELKSCECNKVTSKISPTTTHVIKEKYKRQQQLGNVKIHFKMPEKNEIYVVRWVDAKRRHRLLSFGRFNYSPF